MDTTVPEPAHSESQPVGFAVIPTWLLRDAGVDTQAKMLYLMLSSRIGRDGSCWPSQARLAEEMQCSVPTVQRYIRTLRDLGLVGVTTERTATGRRNRYTLLVDRFGGADVTRTLTSEGSPDEGDAITSEGMGAITSDARTRATGTTTISSDSSHDDVPTYSERLPAEDPVTHPSRPLSSDWLPRPGFRANLVALYPMVEMRESHRRFVDFHLARQTTSKSWEAEFRRWVSNDAERVVERRGGTDDMGIPRNQRGAGPQDRDRLEREQQELIDLAVRSAQERQEQTDEQGN